MNAPHFHEVLIQDEPSPQLPLELQSEGVLRYVWSGRFGQMLIEVRDGLPYVNGKPVEPSTGNALQRIHLPQPGEPT